MSSTNNVISDLWDSVFDQKADPRTRHYILANGYIITFIIAAYWLLILRVLPNFMRKRKAFQLNKLLVVYNGLQVVVNAYIFYGLFARVMNSNVLCEEVDYNDTSEPTLKFVHFGYIYFISKVVDLLDTVFFILRKKQNQVTFLHVWHHSTMILLGWFALRYVAGGHSGYGVFINSFVHIVMYFYYALSALDEKYKRSIWWKKHITQLQIVQFIVGFAIHMGPILSNQDCNYNKRMLILYNIIEVLMSVLFINYYHKNYIVKKQK